MYSFAYTKQSLLPCSEMSPVDPDQREPREEVTVRPLQSTPDFSRCMAVQHEIWGDDFADVVPGSLLQVTQKVGGVAAGAFTERDARLVGFVYGLTGVRRGRSVHWSHMLGVVPEYRRQGIGQKLKQFQRGWLVERGVMEMLWTFDPLVADNAHFNLNLLRVDIDSYEAEMYGETGSDLHSFGTDRFVARWHLSGEAKTAEGIRGGKGGPGEPDECADAPRVRVEIPDDILRIQGENPELARAWRISTRTAFQRLFGDGYRITGFIRSADSGRGIYILKRGVIKGRGEGPRA